MPKTKKEKIIKVGSFITNADISQSRFRHYPVYGPKVTALIELLASIASRMNNDQPEEQTTEVESYGKK